MDWRLAHERERERESSKNIGMTKCLGHFLLSLNNIYLSAEHRRYIWGAKVHNLFVNDECFAQKSKVMAISRYPVPAEGRSSLKLESLSATPVSIFFKSMKINILVCVTDFSAYHHRRLQRYKKSLNTIASERLNI